MVRPPAGASWVQPGDRLRQPREAGLSGASAPQSNLNKFVHFNPRDASENWWGGSETPQGRKKGGTAGLGGQGGRRHVRDSPATGLLIGESLQAAGGRVAEGRGKEETRPQQAALITSGDRGHHYPAVRAAVRGRASACAIARARRHQHTVEALPGERVRIGPWYKHAAIGGPPRPVKRGTRTAPEFQVVAPSLQWHVHEYAHAYKPLSPKRTSGPPPLPHPSIHPPPSTRALHLTASAA